MYAALQEAELAFDRGEIPIGAVVVHKNRIIGRGHNQVEMNKDATAHAEMLAITAASNYLKNKYLDNCKLFVSVEPCLMCSGAIINSRLSEIYFGSFEPKTGACGSVYSPFKNDNKPKIYSGILADESKLLMQTFFKQKRISNIGKNSNLKGLS